MNNEWENSRKLDFFSFESRNAEKLNEDQQMREMQWNAIIIYA